MRLLLVDDSPTVRLRVEQILASSGHETLSAADWITANQVALAEKPDLDVVDENLGDLQGSDFVVALRSFFGPEYPIVIMSSSDVASRAKTAGVNGYVSKSDLKRLGDGVAKLGGCPHPIQCFLTVLTGDLRCDATCKDCPDWDA